MVFNALKQPIRFKNPYKIHDVVMKLIDVNEVTHYVVSEVLSEDSIECRVFNKNGVLTDIRVRFEGDELKSLIPNVVATRLQANKVTGELCL